MARRPRLLAPGVLYPVIVRGNQRQKTFLSDPDYQAYLERLGRYRQRLDVIVYAYCLMPHHVHLLVETTSEPLSKFMPGLQQSYTQYFNRAHCEEGHKEEYYQVEDHRLLGPKGFGEKMGRLRIPLNSATHSSPFRPPIPGIPAGGHRSEATLEFFS